MDTSTYRIDYWQSKCLEQLQRATSPAGIKASCQDITNYGSIFTRDAVMAGIAGILYGNSKVIEGLRVTIETLHDIKGPEGQIASNYKVVDNQITHVSYGTLSPKFDSATWYLLGVAILNNNGFDLGEHYVNDTIHLLNALEYNGKDLIYVPQGGNWADEYPYEGYILYDQILRSWALEQLSRYFDNSSWANKADAIHQKINTAYFNTESKHYNCSFAPSGINETFDFAAHALLGMLDCSTDCQQYESALTWISDTFISQGNLPSAFYPIIHEGSSEWSRVAQFHLYDFRNKPNHFHNGGIWPIWIGWYALALNKHDKHEQLHSLADTFFKLLNSFKEFNFEEYLTGDTYLLSGTPELSYTATGILFLCKSLNINNNPVAKLYNNV